MNVYQRIFGTGLRGLLLSLGLLLACVYFEDRIGWPPIHGNQWLGAAVLVITALLTLAVVVWSFRSLPPTERGKRLVTTGAFRFVRHPLYAAFLPCFDFGLAIFLDNWIYLAWAVLMYPIWHLNILGEERLMRRHFPGEYEEYCARTGRFLPRLTGR